MHAIRVLSYSRQAFLDVQAQDGRKNLTEAALISRRSEDRFRRLSEATVEGIVVHRKGRIVDANEAMAAMFGYKIEQLVERDLIEFMSRESRSAISESLLLGNFKAFEALGLRQDGTKFPIELFNIPWRMGRTA